VPALRAQELAAAARARAPCRRLRARSHRPRAAAGTRQSGLAQFKVARLPEDEPLAEAAKAYAEGLLAVDPDLEAPEHVLLADALAAAYGETELQPLPA
jgi:ATP-dependent DNA helicase RecG